MGRTSTFRKAGGGGFLNNVDATITGYEFTNVFPYASKNPKAKKSDFNSLYFILSALVDGADAPVTTTLWAGSADDFDISADGQTLTPLVDGFELGDGTPLSKLIASYESFGEGALSDDEEVINYSPIVGQRVRFVQQPLSAEEIASLKRRGKPTTVPDKKDPKKSWPIKELVVAAVYGPGAVTAAKAGKPAVSGKGSKSVASAAVNLAEEATIALIGYLKENGGSIQKAKVRMKVLTDAGFKATPDFAKEVATFLTNDENLKALEGIAYSIKSGAITLNE